MQLLRSYWWVIPAVLVVLGVVRFVMMGAESRRLGPPERAPGSPLLCPPTPNCVSSQAEDEEHLVDPLPLAGEPAEAMERLRAIVAAMPGATVVETGPTSLRAEFRSRLLGFVDDLELVADADGGRIDVRSASRIGYSDMGVNRRRVEALRAALGE